MMLNENIREIRKAKNMTQEQLAEAMGVSTASVSKWETGQSAPEISVLTALADFFEVSVDTLLGHEVKADRQKAMLDEMDALADENRFDEAKKIAQKLLRNYPNDYDVVQKVSGLYYRIHVCTGDRSAMEYSVELVCRLFTLAKDPTGTKRFELLRQLGNQYELLDDWEMARKYYEEGNVAGLNDRNLAHVLAREKADRKAADAISGVFAHTMLDVLQDVMRLKDIWEALGEPEKAKAAVQWGLTALESCGSEMMKAYSAMGIAMHLQLAVIAEENGETPQMEAHVRKAARLAGGKTVSGTTSFVTSNMPKTIASEGVSSPEMLLAMLQGAGMESFAGIVQEEMNKL